MAEFVESYIVFKFYHCNFSALFELFNKMNKYHCYQTDGGFSSKKKKKDLKPVGKDVSSG